jgi:zona occludens toxin
MSMDFNLSGIVLLTGIPGSGKTLRMMQIAERGLKEGRPVFQNGINGMSMPGVQEWPDPHAWKDLPPRALLLVDEAQDHFRARPGSVRPPESITDMERIRHSGVCLVLTTQQPTYLDKHLRGLVGRHEHLVEVLAGKQSNVYAFRSTRDDITPGGLSDAELTLWSHPKHLHKTYKSAEVHTKKLRIPFRLKALAAFAVVVIGYGAYAVFGPDAAEATEQGQAAPAAGLALAAAPSSGNNRGTPLEYAAALTPRFENSPGSAPIFDGRAVRAEPGVYCMSTKDTCSCLTEQGTRYQMNYKTCRQIARHGPSYDPFKQPPQQQQNAQDDGLRGEQGMRQAPATAVMTGPQIASYGDLGIGPAPDAN